MNADEFKEKGKQVVDYIADYLENIETMKVTPEVEPGYLRNLLPKEAPKDGEKWDDIFEDFKSKIVPGLTHWQHPRFHAYFPSGNSYPSIIGEMLSAGLGIVGFSWAASPSCAELETIVLDWLGRMLHLPKSLLPFGDSKLNGHKLNVSENEFQCHVDLDLDDEYVMVNHAEVGGGGVVLGSASECILVSLLSARADFLRRLKVKHPFVEEGVLLSKLVMYTSKLAHSCVEKAGMIAMVKIRLLDHDENYAMRGSIVEAAVKNDRNNGLIPFFVSCTLGTTSCCSFDNIKEIGEYCNREGLYLHVDGAYAGSALICEEFRSYGKGLEALSVDPIYLRYKEMDKAIDYRHWGIALSRRFRALKIWFTIRSYGVSGLQAYIRNHVKLAKEFERLLKTDARFEKLGDVLCGLVCFRLAGPNTLTQNLLFLLNDSCEIHVVPAMLDDKYVIRFCVNAKHATSDDMKKAWELIRQKANIIYEKYQQVKGTMDEDQLEFILS